MKTIRQMFNEAMGPGFRWWQGSPDEWEGREHAIAMWFGDFLQEYGDYEPAPPRKEQPRPEPEAWGELKVWGASPSETDTDYSNECMFEAAWPELERRVRRMIHERVRAEIEGILDSDLVTRKQLADAIKAYNDKLVRVCRKAQQKFLGSSKRILPTLADTLEEEAKEV